MPRKMEGDFLVYPASRGYSFQMVVTSAVAWHGKHEIILCKPFVAFDQFFGNFHQRDVARYFGLGAAGDDPFLTVEIHSLDFVEGECLYIYVTQPGKATKWQVVILRKNTEMKT